MTLDSSYNWVGSNQINGDAVNGIEVDSGSEHNTIEGNNVEVLSPPPYFAMLDQNPACGSNLWMNNTFVNLIASATRLRARFRG